MSENQTYKRPESVLIVVHDPDGRILLLQRADIENFWQSVTGSLRWGETPRQAAVRELGEETGIAEAEQLIDWYWTATFDILDVFKSRYSPGTTQNLEHMFSLEVQTDQAITLNPREHLCYSWLNYQDAINQVWSWSNRSAIERVAERYWSAQDTNHR